VSSFAFEVSVALDVSVFIVVSVVLFIELDESIFADVSTELPELLPLQAAIDKETANASRESFKVFFMVVVFNVLIVNAPGGILFGVEKSGSPEVRKLEIHASFGLFRLLD